jgi:hypothetical protein
MKKTIDINKLSNYEYYSRNLLYIQGGEGLVPFDFTRRHVQVEINKEWKKFQQNKLPVTLIILKARRHGVSTYVQSRMFQECHLKSHRQGITIAADDEGCSYIHNMSHTFYEFLPEKLKPMVKYKSSDRLVFDMPKTELSKRGGIPIGLKSSMRTVACNNRAGLGTGNHFIHFSEYAFYRDAESVRKSVIPTVFNVPGTSVVIESTANGMIGAGEAFYDEWKLAKQGKSIFKPLFYSWLEHEGYKRRFFNAKEREELIDTLDPEEEELIDRFGATHEQLNWRRYQIKFLGEGVSQGDYLKGDLENFHEQYPVSDDEAFIVSGNRVFNRLALKEYKDKCKRYKWRGEVESDRLIKDSQGNLRVWEMPQKDEKYIITIDPSSGEPGATDFGCIEVLRVMNVKKTGLMATQSAEWHGRTGAEALGQIAVELGKRYNNAILAPEVFGYGHAVLARIQAMDYWNVFKRRVVDSVEQVSKTKLGWKTDSVTKPTLLTYGRYCVNNKLVVINSEDLVDEMMIFVRDETSASAYGRGKDDRVMTFLIGLKVIEQEYGESPVEGGGVLQPTDEKPLKQGDPLHYDSFWDKRKSKHKHWMDL